MTLSVRLPLKVEQELTEYCAKKRVSKSEAVKLALERMLNAKPGRPAQDAYARKFMGSDPRPGDVARHSRRLLREHFRNRTSIG